MRKLSLILAVMVALSASVLARNESLDELKARLPRADNGHRVDLCLQIARMQLDSTGRLYDEGKINEARAAIADIVTYSEQAGETAAKSGKKIKKAEILMREMANKLREIKHSLNYDDQAPVQQAADRLEEVRNNLLKAMFAKGKE